MARPTNNSRWIEFQLDMKSIVRGYADRYLAGAYGNDSLDEYCDQAAREIKLPDMKQWVRREITQRSQEVTI